MTVPRPLLDADLLAWAVILEFRAGQQRDGITVLLLPCPPCPTCGETVLNVEIWRAFERDLDSRRMVMQPCEHTYMVTDADIQRIHERAGDMLSVMRASGSGWTTDKVVEQARARMETP